MHGQRQGNRCSHMYARMAPWGSTFISLFYCSHVMPKGASNTKQLFYCLHVKPKDASNTNKYSYGVCCLKHT